jgi:hypothetical protein
MTSRPIACPARVLLDKKLDSLRGYTPPSELTAELRIRGQRGSPFSVARIGQTNFSTLEKRCGPLHASTPGCQEFNPLFDFRTQVRGMYGDFLELGADDAGS